jgi:hypothetical protein
MGKAKANHTPEQPPLDDDTQWMSLLDAFLLHFEQLHEVNLVKLALEEVNLVELDVDQALAGGELPCMRRNLVTGERERVLPSFWEANQVKCVNFPEHGWHAGIYRRREQRWGGWDHRDDDHVYFVSKADYAKRWPAALAQPQPDRDKPEHKGAKVELAKEVLSIVRPGGVPADAKYKDVLEWVGPEYCRRGRELPKRDIIARARGLRK